MKATENQPETEKNGSQCLGTMNSNVTLCKPDDGKSLLEKQAFSPSDPPRPPRRRLGGFFEH
ncbi:unnamed protein product [Prunus armeniaca]